MNLILNMFILIFCGLNFDHDPNFSVISRLRQANIILFPLCISHNYIEPFVELLVMATTANTLHFFNSNFLVKITVAYIFSLIMGG